MIDDKQLIMQLNCNIIEAFEDFLDSKGVIVPNDEKQEAIKDGSDPETIGNIYGTDYYDLEDEITSILETYGLIKKGARYE